MGKIPRNKELLSIATLALSPPLMSAGQEWQGGAIPKHTWVEKCFHTTSLWTIIFKPAFEVSNSSISAAWCGSAAIVALASLI